mmetsp:Transcript_13958/g.29442  ORF Transcript_13958/g.29442 Transcript_13958/m.29442 type:complete len:383 (+) Transcript_13958:253-1401(+)
MSQLKRVLSYFQHKPPAPSSPAPPPFSLSSSVTTLVTDPLSTLQLCSDKLHTLYSASLSSGYAPLLVTVLLIVLSAFLVRWLLQPKQPTLARSPAEPATDEYVQDAEDDDENADDPSMIVLLPQLMRNQFSRLIMVHPTEFIASVIHQLGKTAFLIVSTVLSITAIAVQTVAQHVRKVDRMGTGLATRWIRELTDRFSGFSFKEQVEKVATRVFRDADVTGDGSIDGTEMYCLILSVYVQLNAFAYVTPPSREQVEKLQSIFDLDNDGKLDIHEFNILAACLCENVAVRVGCQTLISLIIAPSLSLYATRTLASSPAISRATLAPVPSVLVPYVGNVETAATAVTAATAAACAASFEPRASTATLPRQATLVEPCSGHRRTS